MTDQADHAAPVHLERGDEGVALITLDRPKVNALSAGLLEALAGILDDLRAEPPGAVVVWGGPRRFAAGADIAELADPGRTGRLAAAFRASFDRLAALPRPSIAAIAGYALGGGCELALACDLRVVGAGARLGQPEVALGLLPGGGGTQRLARLIGPSRAKELIYTGRQVGAEEALRIGLANQVVPDDEVLGRALAWAAELAAGPSAALAYAKDAIDRGLDGALDDGLDLEAQHFRACLETEDARTGIASFLEHGPGQARFRGR